MPQIFDNIDATLLPALQARLKEGLRADFCVGYFNLRGWRQIAPLIEPWAGGEGACVRLLVGMQSLPEDDLRAALRLNPGRVSAPLPQRTRYAYICARSSQESRVLGKPAIAPLITARPSAKK